MCSLDPAPVERAENGPAARLSANLAAVRARIARAAVRAGRDPAAVRLLAVTKSAGAPTAALLADLGLLELGESRVQELERKLDWFAARGRAARASSVRWHLIGHLQRNKVRRALRSAAWLHSLDSLRLLEALEQAAAEENARPRVYFEVRLARGASGAAAERTGFDPSAFSELFARAKDLGHVRPVGLMAMGPAPEPEDPKAAGAEPAELSARQAASRVVFAELAALRERWRDRAAGVFENDVIELSMGMSSDLEAAVAEQSDVVRVGTALFEGVEPAPDAARGRTGAGA